MNGIHTSEDINKKLADSLGVEYGFLWDVFVKDCQNMKVEDGVLEQLKKLRNRFKIVLITDNMDCFDRFTVPSLKLDEYFDVIVNSFNERLSKNENDGQLFREVIERVGSNPIDSILMDNSEKSCSVFEKLGGTSFLVTREKPLAHWLEKVNV
jgi:FMN phosphatase YigB (HAD superfamily)